MAKTGLILGLMLLTPGPVHGEPPLRIYRCTDAAGNVTLQNDRPCAKGQRQELRTMQAPAPAAPMPPPPPDPYPAAAPAAAPPTAPPVAPARAPAPPPLLPPPPLHRCHVQGGNSYLSEDGEPPARCIPLAVGGIDGSRSNRSGAEACQMRRDHCERIPDEDLCPAWRQYDLQAESLVALNNPDLAERARAMHARSRQVMTATTCADIDTASP
ncbi:DUF4124 domain-containing protein [Luteimonas sp. e5]